jgi:hypothetical protein
MYKVDKMVCNMLKLASKVGPVGNSLYLALYYYRTGRYNEALRVLNITTQRLSQPHIMGYTVNTHRYSDVVGNMSLSRRMKAAWLNYVVLDWYIYYIDELILEQETVTQMEPLTCCELSIPPIVLTHMLLLLSHYRLGNRFRYLQSLTDLQTLLLYDADTLVPLHLGDISWQILGICQHVVGDLHGALQSYQMSLRQERTLYIHVATENRIRFLESQLRRNS